jgi:hypothetical protein
MSRNYRDQTSELAQRLGEFPYDVDIVAYYWGPYCVFSHDAVRLLVSGGRRAVRLTKARYEILRCSV